MLRIIFLIAAIVAVCACKPKIDPQYKNTHVVVYGRDNCSLTQSMIKRLKSEGVPYSYRNIDKPHFNNEMWNRVEQSNIDQKSFTHLPAVDINRHFMVNARTDEVMAQINKSLHK